MSKPSIIEVEIPESGVRVVVITEGVAAMQDLSCLDKLNEKLGPALREAIVRKLGLWRTRPSG